MPKNPTLKLFTKTWQPKNVEPDENRPLTATLDKPTILNINLIKIIDMSTVRKEFLNISNLCRFPIKLTKQKKTIISRPLSLPSSEKVFGMKNRKRPETCEKKQLNNYFSKTTKDENPLKKVDEIVEKKIMNDANNNKTFKIPRKRAGNIAKLSETKKDLEKLNNLPKPCRTCGRSDQPERFHSHPVTPLKPVRKEEPPKMKNSVQKPVAIKYKSKQLPEKNPSQSALQRKQPSLPTQKLVHTPPNVASQLSSTEDSSIRPLSAKKTLTCYICGREFGTASLPLHEPKCLEKWHRENDSLPISMQRKPPIKPSDNISAEEWNQLAWKASQATLTPCSNCGRTFFPDRLIVHQRSCKTVLDNDVKSSIEKPTRIPLSNIECYICGKMFGKHSIGIHEKQCLRKWRNENDLLPEDSRALEPVRKPSQTISVTLTNESRPPSGKKSTMFPCYICGRLFTTNSSYIHEPQCLKMWNIENEKLPLHKRRSQPLKPDIKITQDGKIDYNATSTAIWQSYLEQLVPCQFCSRTFNPDRVKIHEKTCKG